MTSPVATRSWAKFGMVLMSLLIQHSTFVSRPLEDGRIIQGPKADILNPHDVDPIDSPLQPQDEVLIDVLVSEEARTHDSRRARILARRPSGGSFASIPN